MSISFIETTFYKMNIELIKDTALSLLTEKRRIHTEGVLDTAIKLGKVYGLESDDLERVEIACLFHDVFRGRKGEALNSLIDKYCLPNKYYDNANLAHGKLASAYIKSELGIEDTTILDAVSFHTTGRPEMSLIEKIVFIADAIEPGRDYPGVDGLRRLAFSDIDRACLESLRGTVEHLKKSGVSEDEIDPDTLNAIEYFEKTIIENKE